MTRKDYQLLADVIVKYQWAVKELKAKPPYLIHALADALALDNPRFDRSKFLAACGLELDQA